VSQPSRVLVVGDPYMPAGSYAEALAGLGGRVTVTSLEIGRSEPAPPRGALAESTFEGREFLGREAPGTTLGLVGLGHVGREVAVRARALGFTVSRSSRAIPRRRARYRPA
jgi:lactate dehydrogenase-like 2-hydroxyacid dehydrogenase